MQFEHPGWLVLLVLLVPVLWMSRHARRSLGPTRGTIIPLVRAILVVCLVMSLAGPLVNRGGETLTVAVVVDRSRSVPSELLDQAVGWVQDASSRRVAGDQLAVVQVAHEARAAVMPSAESLMTLDLSPGRRDGTNLAAGVELAKSILPDGGAYRILLVSDGNETEGSIASAADVALAAGIPIDVLELTYEHVGEVQVDRIDVPDLVRPGQPIDVRITLRARSATTGRLTLLKNGVIVPLQGGDAMALSLEPGPSVVTVTVEADDAPSHRYEAIFEPTPGSGDVIDVNNRAVGFSFGSGTGRVLIVSSGGSDAAMLVDILRASGINAIVTGPAALDRGVAEIAGYEAIALVDVPRWSVSDSADAQLAAWVRDGGGGLLVTGGPDALGAGGWIGSKLADVLPVELDPPADRQIRRGALVLILHSCEMPRGNYWGRRVAEAAIESLTSQDLVGILEYNNRTGGSSWSLPLQEAGNKRKALDSAASLSYGDMPSFSDSMTDALSSLRGADAGQKHIIIISDGDPAPPPMSLLDECAASKVSVSTVMVGGHGTPLDRRRMQTIASRTNGRFYDVSDPSSLPNIFIQEAQLISRSLIQEGEFQPVVSGGGGPLGDQLQAVPPIGGFVLTEPRGGVAIDAIQTPTSDGDDPLLSWWHHGLGRAVVFASDLGSRWAVQWPAWEGNAFYWERIVRWLLRPGDDGVMSMRLQELDGGEVTVELESIDADNGFLNFVETRGAVIGPGGVSVPLDLRQVGPGRYRGTFRMTEPGAWVAAVRWRGGTDGDGEPATGWVQGATVMNWSDEDRSSRSNEALLEAVANRTGGRVFELSEPPELVELFDRTGLTIKQSMRSIWAMLAVLAAVLLLIDVTIRRIAPDARHAAARRRLALAAEGAGETAASAWRRVRQPQASTHEEKPDQSAGSTRTEVPVSPSSTKTPESSTEQEPEPDDTLSKLRAARRRLRGDEGDT